MFIITQNIMISFRITIIIFLIIFLIAVDGLSLIIPITILGSFAIVFMEIFTNLTFYIGDTIFN